jgi:hypothetical protein
MDDGLFGMLGRMVSSLQSAPTGVSERIWDELRPWFARLAVNAAPKWLPNIAFGSPCSVPVYQAGRPIGPCYKSAITTCDACGEPCCLDHSRIDQFGDAICYLCVVEAVKYRRATDMVNGGRRPRERMASGGARPEEPPPKPAPLEDATWARKVLSVNRESPWEEVRQAHRKLSGKWHPDRHQSDAAKEKAEEKFKRVQRAFSVLTKDRDEKAQACS